MGKFIEYIEESAADNKLIKRMDRIRKSLSNHIARGNRTGGHQSQTLLDRYQDTKEEMRDADLWKDWCKKSGSHVDHDAYDLFA